LRSRWTVHVDRLCRFLCGVVLGLMTIGQSGSLSEVVRSYRWAVSCFLGACDAVLQIRKILAGGEIMSIDLH
jgi:hypothetical protein